MAIRPRVKRNFKIIDAMTLTAAIAFAIVFCKMVMGAYDPDFGDPVKVFQLARLNGVFAAPVYILFWFEIAAPFLLSFATALAILRWVPPRTPRRRLFRQPGHVAMMALAASTGSILIGWVVLCLPLKYADHFVAKGALIGQYNDQFRLVLFATMAGGAAVAASWVVLALGGRWRSEPDWIDRAGRILGVLAILFLPFMLWASLLTLI